MKKFVAILLAAMMLFSMISFASASGLEGTYDVTLWVPQEAVELTLKQVADFNANNGQGIVINATVEPVSEADSATNMITDVEAGGDIYFFAQDQFSRLVQAGALARLGVGASEFVKANNAPGSVAAVQSGDDFFAYPLTADNGYFMYYDKSVIPEEDIDSLEKLIADCEAAGKFFSMELQTSAWYLAGFFFGTGCHSEWVSAADGTFTAVDDDFNSDKGLIAAKGMKKLLDSDMHLSSSSGAEFANGAAVVVTGIWDYTTVQGILGDNMGVADLPSFEVDGTEYHIGSYSGLKILGVKPQTDAVKAAALHQLAQYLTSEKGQIERFEAMAWGPANINAQQNEAVLANAALTALNQQNAYATAQGSIHGSWWDLAKVIGDDVKAATNDDEIKAALQKYEDNMAALFNMSDEVRNAFTVIGDINGDTWTLDLAMAEENGVWTTTDAYTLDAGTQFKVRQGKSWDVAYPADNYVVETAGTYYIQLDTATETVSVVPAE